MNENIKAFLEKMAADPELQAKFSQIKDPDEAYAVASSIQSGFTKEEFIESMKAIKDAANEDLTDEDLAKSAGGDSEDVIVSISASVAITAVVSPTAAAAI